MAGFHHELVLRERKTFALEEKEINLSQSARGFPASIFALDCNVSEITHASYAAPVRRIRLFLKTEKTGCS